MLNIHDGQALSEWDTAVFNKRMIALYRNSLLDVCKNRYNQLDDELFLEKIGALCRQADGRLVPTVSGVLMFGDSSCIRTLFPNYFLDYQEEINSNHALQRRITSDRGMECGNIFEFYLTVYERLSNLSVIKRNDVLEPIKQIFANSLIHADYAGRRGIVIKVSKDAIEISNPGSSLIPERQIMKGGISDPRNPTIFKMFSEMGGGDRAGMGIAEANRIWTENEWRGPLFTFEENPNRTCVCLFFR